MRKTIYSWLWLFSLLIVCGTAKAQTYTLFNEGLNSEITDFTTNNPSEAGPWDYYGFDTSSSSYNIFGSYKIDSGNSKVANNSWFDWNEYLYISTGGGVHMNTTNRPAIRFKAPAEGYYKMTGKMTRDNYGDYNSGKAQVWAYFNFVTSLGKVVSMGYDMAVSTDDLNNEGGYFTQKEQEIYVHMAAGDYVTFEIGTAGSGMGNGGTTWNLVQVTTVDESGFEEAPQSYDYYALANKNELETLLAEAAGLLDNPFISITNEPGSWTQNQVDILQTAKETAQLIMDKQDANTNEVDAASLALSAAVTLFTSQQVIRLEKEDTFASGVYYIKVGDSYLTAPAEEKKDVCSLSSLIVNGGKNNQMWNIQYNTGYDNPDRYALATSLAGSDWDEDGSVHLDEVGRVQTGNTATAHAADNNNHTWRNHSLYNNGSAHCIFNVKTEKSVNITPEGNAVTVEKHFLYTFVPVVSDFTALQTVIDAMDAFLPTVVAGTNPGDYSASEKEAFETVLNNAKALVASGFSSEEIINAQQAALIAAKESLVTNVITLVMDASILPSGAYYILKDDKYLTAGINGVTPTFTTRNSNDLRDNQVWNIQFDFDNTTRGTKNYSLTTCLSGNTWTIDGTHNLTEEATINPGHTAYVQEGGDKNWRTYEISFNGTAYSLYATCGSNDNRRGYLTADENVTQLVKVANTNERRYEFALVPVEEFALLYPANISTNSANDLSAIKKAVLCNADYYASNHTQYSATWTADNVASLNAALGSAAKLLEIDATQASLESDANFTGLLAECNPNALLHVADAQHAGGERAVVDDVLASLTLEDEQPFQTTYGFTVTSGVTYTRDFNENASGAYSTADAPKWQAICLPFDVTEVKGMCPVNYVGSDNSTHDWTAGMRTLDADGDYWLYELKEDGFVRNTSGIEANKPYIIAFPYSWDAVNTNGYSPKLNVSGAVTFSGDAVEITQAKQGDWGVYSMVNNFSSVDASLEASIYVLSEDGQYFDSEAEATATPFRPYIVAASSSASSRIYLVEGGETTGMGEIKAVQGNLNIVMIPGGVEITCQKACRVEVVTLGGSLLAVFELKEGTQQISLPVGVLFINGQKVIVTE